MQFQIRTVIVWPAKKTIGASERCVCVTLIRRTKKSEFSAERKTITGKAVRHRPALNNYEATHTLVYKYIVGADRNGKRIISVAATVLLAEREIRPRPSALDSGGCVRAPHYVHTGGLFKKHKPRGCR
jgi:hypothetical protein